VPTLILEILEYVDASKTSLTVRQLLAAEATDETGSPGDRRTQIGSPPRQQWRARQQREPGE
jgi:hypothetical protein